MLLSVSFFFPLEGILLQLESIIDAVELSPNGDGVTKDGRYIQQSEALYQVDFHCLFINFCLFKNS